MSIEAITIEEIIAKISARYNLTPCIKQRLRIRQIFHHFVFF